MNNPPIISCSNCGHYTEAGKKCVSCGDVWPEESLSAPGAKAPAKMIVCYNCHGFHNRLLRVCPCCGANNLVIRQSLTAAPEVEGQGFSQARWESLLAKTIEQINYLSKAKGGEYAGDEDRLANFRRNAKALDLDMESVWAVYAGKHWDAIQQYIKDRRAGRKREVAEPTAGRVDDLIVYLLLFKAMLEETQDHD